MARNGRRVLARRRREHERDVRRGWVKFDPDAAVEEALGAAPERVIGARSSEDDRKRLRGIPVVGGASGEVPGTRPDRNRRLERWSGRS